MSAPVLLQGLAADVRAPSRLGISEADHRTPIEAVSTQLALDDEAQSDARREADIEEAEWIVGVLHAAGYTVRKVTP